MSAPGPRMHVGHLGWSYIIDVAALTRADLSELEILRHPGMRGRGVTIHVGGRRCRDDDLILSGLQDGLSNGVDLVIAGRPAVVSSWWRALRPDAYPPPRGRHLQVVR